MERFLNPRLWKTNLQTLFRMGRNETGLVIAVLALKNTAPLLSPSKGSPQGMSTLWRRLLWSIQNH